MQPITGFWFSVNMAVRTSLLEPVRTSLLSYPVPRTTLTPPFPVPQPSAPPPRIMPLTPETEEEWYQVFPSQVDPKVNLSRGGVWMPDRHGQWWPVYPDDPPDILIQCAIGKIWRCRHRQFVRLNPARHHRPPSSQNRWTHVSIQLSSPCVQVGCCTSRKDPPLHLSVYN